MKEERIEIDTKIKWEDIYDFILYNTYSKFSGFLINVLGVAIVFIGLILFLKREINLVRFILYIICSFVFLAYTPILIKLRLQKQVKEMDQNSLNKKYIINYEGIEDKDLLIPWNKIIRFVNTPKTIGLYYEKDKAIIIPKRDLKIKDLSYIQCFIKKSDIKLV